MQTFGFSLRLRVATMAALLSLLPACALRADIDYPGPCLKSGYWYDGSCIVIYTEDDPPVCVTTESSWDTSSGQHECGYDSEVQCWFYPQGCWVSDYRCVETYQWGNPPEYGWRCELVDVRMYYWNQCLNGAYF